VPHGSLHILNLAAPPQVIAFRQFHLLIHLLLELGHETAQIPVFHIDAHHDAALAHFPADLGRAVFQANIGHGFQGHLDPGGGGDQHPADGFHVAPIAFRQAHGGGKAPFPFVNVRGFLAADGGLDHVVHVAGVEAQAGNGLAVDFHHQILLAGDPLHPQILGALDGLGHLGDGFRFGLEYLEVVPENLDGDVGTDPGDHFIHPVRNGLGHDNLHPGQHLELVPHGLGDVILVPALRPFGSGLEADDGGGFVGSLGIGGGFPPAHPGNHGFHPGHGHDELGGLHFHFDGLGQGNIGHPVNPGNNGAFLHFRDKSGTQEG